MPATVLHDEAFYFEGYQGKEPIKLLAALKQGHICELEASLEDDLYLQSLVKPVFFPSIDPGEREALALLKNPNFKDYECCKTHPLCENIHSSKKMFTRSEIETISAKLGYSVWDRIGGNENCQCEWKSFIVTKKQ